MIRTTTRLRACGCIDQREVRLARPDPWACTRPCAQHARSAPSLEIRVRSGQSEVPPELRVRVRALENRAWVRKAWRKRELELARRWETHLTAILTGEMTSP
jgi:hypothetical protein